MGPIFGILSGALALIIGVSVLGSLVGQPDYANDDYEPAPASDAPVPLDEPEANETPDDLLLANELYAQQIAAPVRCEAGDIDSVTASDEEVEAHIDELMGCLMRVWQPAFEGTKYTLVRPKVNIYHESVSTPCNGGESMGINAMYCPANQQVYWSRNIVDAVPAYGEDHVMDMVMAHEFSHGVQSRANISIAWQSVAMSSAESEALELSRRSESQADCMAGMFISASAQSMDLSEGDFDRIVDAAKAGGSDNTSGDPNAESTHPQADSRDYWMRTGMNTVDVKTCDTWSAPAEAVR